MGLVDDHDLNKLDAFVSCTRVGQGHFPFVNMGMVCDITPRAIVNSIITFYDDTLRIIYYKVEVVVSGNP